jgi:two-component system NtrC family sensor kinase
VAVECAWAPTSGGKVLTVEAVADQLRQVFLNLVLNAVDAMPQGGTLRISTSVEHAPDDGPPRVRIAFADTGLGIVPDVRRRLFEPFFTTKEEGAGLGLSISHGIIQAHGGEISATSEPGQGSTFTVWLPVEQPSEEADDGGG